MKHAGLLWVCSWPNSQWSMSISVASVSAAQERSASPTLDQVVLTPLEKLKKTLKDREGSSAKISQKTSLMRLSWMLSMSIQYHWPMCEESQWSMVLFPCHGLWRYYSLIWMCMWGYSCAIKVCSMYLKFHKDWCGLSDTSKTEAAPAPKECSAVGFRAASASDLDPPNRVSSPLFYSSVLVSINLLVKLIVLLEYQFPLVIDVQNGLTSCLHW